jgi:hypothetical protein
VRLADLGRSAAEHARHYLVWSSRHPALFALHVRAYGAVERLLRAQFGAEAGVEAIYLSHGLALGECFPGLSDFDLVLVFDAPDRLAFYERIRRRWIALRRFLPINDLTLLSRAEFELWQALGGGGDPRDELEHWRCLWGDDRRRDGFDAGGEQAELDRVAHGLGHFQNLMQVALKEERRSADFALFARRQVHKSFWSSILALDRSSLAIPRQRERVAAWMRDHGAPEPVDELQAMYAGRFQHGAVSRLRFSAGAQAFRTINRSLAALRAPRAPLAPPALLDAPDLPIANHREVEERVAGLTAAILKVIGDGVQSILLASTGSVRGYAYVVILADELDAAQVARALLDLRAIHRVFDDPWFNEHFPGGIPTVLSRSMFAARLRVGRSSLQYLHKFRRVLHGSDLYREALEESATTVAADRGADDLLRERLVYSLHLNQVYLRRLKPALLDFVTLYHPRMALQRTLRGAPATAEEAVFLHARHAPGPEGEYPRRFLERHGGKDLDALERTLDRGAFAEAWPLIRQPLIGAEDVPR